MANWKKILVAVDETATAEQALRYVGEVISSPAGLQISLLYIYPEPSAAQVQNGLDVRDYQLQRDAAGQQILARSHDILASYGIPAEQITSICRMATSETISKTILQVQADGEYGTVVVGKRGVSKAEEFLFGSISNTMVRNSRGFAVLVVG
ncbi:MAG: hypothetical protein A2511_03405 [Deltaproteobacteria bacterium RIFOXYD12_FULL_50_9]|nr:MAG: hypothetical protein A2511_03405 [Deltaproteobacteria bacterium RIFOXYD12_FULL_50_9]